jgi:hypothetical protein
VLTQSLELCLIFKNLTPVECESESDHTRSVIIERKKLVDSLFESEVVKKNGFILRKPKEWV